MKGTYLGEFEELVLLVVGILNGEAYGVSVMDEILKQVDRKVSVSSIHTTLSRLEKKGFLKSNTGGATAERGGRRKRFFELTNLGIKAIEMTRQVRNDLFGKIPAIVFHRSE